MDIKKVGKRFTAANRGAAGAANRYSAGYGISGSGGRTSGTRTHKRTERHGHTKTHGGSGGGSGGIDPGRQGGGDSGARSCGEKRNTRTHGSRNARNARRAQKRTQGEQIPTERRNGAEISGEETREAAPLIPGI